MLTFLYVLLLICIISLTYFKFRKVVTINIMFSVIWCFAGIANNNEYASLYKLSSRTNIYIVLSIIVFNCVYILFGKSVDIKYTLKLLQINLNHHKKNMNVLIVLNLFCYIFMVPIFLKAINIIQNQSWARLRAYAFMESDLLATALQIRISIWIVYPIFLFTIILSLIYIIIQKRDFILTAMGIIDIALYSVSFGGRGLIVKSIILFGLTLILLYQQQRIRIKFRKRYFLGGGIAILILSNAISARSLGGLSVINNLIVYLVGSFSYFDVITNSSKYTDLNSVYLFGTGALGFLINPFLYVMSLFPGVDNLTSEKITKLVTTNFEFISSDYMYNALPTSMYPFWRDFGIVGIILGTMFFAVSVIYVEKKFHAEMNLRWLIIYLIFIYAVFESAMQYDLLTIQFSFIILITILLTIEKKNKIEQR